MVYERYDAEDHSHMYQGDYNMTNGGEVWYPAQAAAMDPARAWSRRQAHHSSQDYHSDLDSIDEYASGPGLTRAYSYAPPRSKIFGAPTPSQTSQIFPALIINGARNTDMDPARNLALMEDIDYAVNRLAPAETGELGSNWPYANSKFDAVQDAHFSVNSDA